MADAAIAKGLKEIDGDIVADDSYLPYDPYPAGWTIGDMFFEFGAPIGAITFNDNSISIQVQPGAREGDPADSDGGTERGARYLHAARSRLPLQAAIRILRSCGSRARTS